VNQPLHTAICRNILFGWHGFKLVQRIISSVCVV